jgi:hypothetical protein
MKEEASHDSIEQMKVFLFVFLATVLEATGDAIVRVTGGLIASLSK